MDRVAYRSPDQTSFCGPLALTTVTGMSYKKACALINDGRGVSRQSPIDVIHSQEIPRLLSKLGFRFITRLPAKRKNRAPSIARWEMIRSPRERLAPVMCVGSMHLSVIEGDRIWDTYTKSSGDYLCEYPKRRFLVEEYYVLVGGPYLQHALVDKIKCAIDFTHHCSLSVE